MPLPLVSRHSVLGHAWTLSTSAGSRVVVTDTRRELVYAVRDQSKLTLQLLQFPRHVRRLCGSMVSFLPDA